MTEQFDVIVVGAGAAGMMSAIEAGKRGRKVLLVDHAKKIGEKIRISGGGRCNFTNIHTHPSKFISNNPKFVISALKQYTQNNFIDLIKKHNIKFHEKKLGQLFCDESAQQIIDMLLLECEMANVILKKDTTIDDIDKRDDKYFIVVGSDKYFCQSLIIATGGLSIPKIGASKFGYDIAQKFGLKVIETLPALVPLTFSEKILAICKELTGLSVEAVVSFKKTFFEEGMLFTHRGLSGPSILQISSYWKLGDNIKVNLSPKLDVDKFLNDRKISNPKQDISIIVSEILPKRLAHIICNENNVNGNICELSNKVLTSLSNSINAWAINPTGTEGYRTAEVTLGGIDTEEISSKTMMSNKHPGLFFIGEVVDVTGHLGGYNFQWAWSSGYVAGQYA
ncbi:NAD(P)/FAD-dependent oxidoreductase [Candidatus Pelagibacter ubique]|jgi:predicted Rossmann fold flavoprotein|nr:NAD(P)/FAD-dependent oxidoreductase [Candidatus Pelagibacter bacterium]MDA7456921.1 NAD(P)/FAD-dependent oxidoreductase [Candidatus Pelagibacter ubique]MDA8804363.1 NAD(P)/FAD-dependent oxidoreductase [Candidatus Pelagibacter bacterium]MDA8825690.1 NAD(P)/FAD-dependent oxidoreductase [Candidatus Pelagibacter bacterium]MDC0578382.1 NAD(P)/FAD-dependent oxidoreductase [Candidatus Pelagibacter ubique]MDC0926741.1 NAD(P)/FAD-dependent oxidoreductase [Candidatus Pelagibacter ubique]